MSEGGLASSSATSPLAVVQQIDKVYVDVRQSAMSLAALRDTAAESSSQNPHELPVKIKTIADKPFGHDGKIQFSDISVDSTTGSLGIRILVSNPDQQLLPGMYIRAMVPRAIYSHAIRVPQEAIIRDPAGRPQIIVVGADKIGDRRTVDLGPIVEGQYIVTGGLGAGETVVVLGQDRVQSGQPLESSPYSPPAPQTKS
jgi:multidrug efflux system membrane fusion protein